MSTGEINANVTAFESVLSDIKGGGSQGEAKLKEKYLSGDIELEVYAAAKIYSENRSAGNFEEEFEFLLRSYKKAAEASKPNVFTDRLKVLEHEGEVNKKASSIILILLGLEPSAKRAEVKGSKHASLQSTQSSQVDPCGRSFVRRSSC